MVNELAQAVTDLILIGRAHQPRAAPPARAPLSAVIDAARRVREMLTACWGELGRQAVVEDELVSIEAHLERLVRLLTQMEQAPRRSWRAELAAECAHLHSINDALREIVDHRAVVQHAPWLIASVVAAAAALHTLRLVAAGREDDLLSWAELPGLRVVSQVHLEKLAELALVELRAQSDVRFCFKRWSAEPDDDRPGYGYVFENRRYRPSREVLQNGGDPKALAIVALAEHRQQAFSTFAGVAPVQQLLQTLAATSPAHRAAA